MIDGVIFSDSKEWEIGEQAIKLLEKPSVNDAGKTSSARNKHAPYSTNKPLRITSV